MSATRLSPLDDSFLAAESPTAHMHVGWAAVFEPPADRPRPSFEQLRDHIGSRLWRAPRYRQRLSPAPLELDAPSWVDDERFDVDRHLIRSESHDLDHLVAAAMSRQLRRDRPLWEIWIADELEDGRIGLVGKVHHCMVDGIAAVDLALLLLDPTREPPSEPADEWRPEPEPDPISRLAAAGREKLSAQRELAGEALNLLRSADPRRLPGQAAGAAGAIARSLRPATPAPVLNERISTRRRLARVKRPLAELQEIKQRYGTTVNDVYLAIAAGAMRQLFFERGEAPRSLKTMVPVNVRDENGGEELGNRISFMFIDLPCEDPDPGRRLRRLHEETERSKHGGDPSAANSVLRMLGYAPRVVQRLASRVVSSPRMFNLTVSNIPGPSEPMYMRGCELQEAYPVVPIPDRHALSIGMTTIQDRACFGLYTDRSLLGDTGTLATALERSGDELLEVA